MSGSTQTRPQDCWQHFKSASQSWSMEHSCLLSTQVDMSSDGTGHVPFLAEMYKCEKKKKKLRSNISNTDTDVSNMLKCYHYEVSVW